SAPVSTGESSDARNLLPETRQHIVGVTQVVQTTVPPGRLVDQGLVDELAQLGAERVGGGRYQLGHEDGGELLGRVDPEEGAGRAAPGELAGAGQDLVGDRVEQDREPEAVADPVEGGLGEQPPSQRLEV